VIHGSYTDDTAAYLAIVLVANLLGYGIGLLVHHLVAVSIARRARS
jgi:hypothetical protein